MPSLDLSILRYIRAFDPPGRRWVQELFHIAFGTMDAPARRPSPVQRDDERHAKRCRAPNGYRRFSAIDSGLGGPAFPVSVVGLDQMANWLGLDGAAYDAKRERWREAILGAIDREFPGFAAQVAASVFSTASTMSTYLNAPEGAIYGFAPLPPSGQIWRGPERSPNTALPGLYLASSYAGSGGFTGAIPAGAAAAKQALANRITTETPAPA
jgi:phytoene dehydrogenase-like protein